MIKISRERWIIACKDCNYDGTQIYSERQRIFCGSARNHSLEYVDEVKNISIKTYISKKKAEISFISSWIYGKNLINSGIAKAVKVIEEISEVELQI